jgi:hypothetical protein
MLVQAFACNTSPNTIVYLDFTFLGLHSLPHLQNLLPVWLRFPLVLFQHVLQPCANKP